jgi:hypothetical protein
MIVIYTARENENRQRVLAAFSLPPEFPAVVEAEMISAHKVSQVLLGGHSHPHSEGFFLVEGSLVAKTWTSEKGYEHRALSSPVMFMFKPREEHQLICSYGTILVGLSPVAFGEENNTPAEHLPA